MLFRSERASQKLAFDPLPEVTLRGDLHIDSLDDPDLFAEVEPVSIENLNFTPQIIPKDGVIVTKRYQKSHPEIHPVSIRESFPVDEPEVITKAFTPVRVTRERTIESKDATGAPVRFRVVPIFVFVSLTLSMLILGLTSYAESDGLQFKQSVKFSLASVVNSVQDFPKSY